jgi:hypothetical protein
MAPDEIERLIADSDCYAEFINDKWAKLHINNTSLFHVLFELKDDPSLAYFVIAKGPYEHNAIPIKRAKGFRLINGCFYSTCFNFNKIETYVRNHYWKDFPNELRYNFLEIVRKTQKYMDTTNQKIEQAKRINNDRFHIW